MPFLVYIFQSLNHVTFLLSNCLLSASLSLQFIYEIAFRLLNSFGHNALSSILSDKWEMTNVQYNHDEEIICQIAFVLRMRWTSKQNMADEY